MIDELQGWLNYHLQLNFTTQQIIPVTTFYQCWHNAQCYVISCAVNEYNVQKLICRYFNYLTFRVTHSQILHGTWDSSIHIVTRRLAGQLRNHGLIPGRSKRLLSTSKHLYWLWSPFSLLFQWILGSFPESKGARAWSWPLNSI